MKTYILSLLTVALGLTSLQAQFDDLYFNLNDSDIYAAEFDDYDYYDDEYDEYSYDDEFYEDYDYFLEDDYYYSNRIRRFNRPNTFLVGGWNPYSGRFYNPYNYYDNFFVWNQPSFVINIGRSARFVPGYWYGGFAYNPWNRWNNWNRLNRWDRGWAGGGWGGAGWAGGGFGGGGFGYNDCIPGGGRFINANNGTRFTSTASDRGNYYGSRRSGSLASSDRGTNRQPRVSDRSRSNERVRRGDSRSVARGESTRSSRGDTRYTYKGDAERSSASRADRRSQSRSSSLGTSRSNRSSASQSSRRSSNRSSMGNSRSSSRNSSMRSTNRSSSRSSMGRSSSRSSSRSSGGRSGRGRR